MLGKVHSESPGWDEVDASSKKPRGQPPSDSYRKVERDQHRRPPKEQEEQAGVEQKKDSRSLFELSRQKPKPKVSSGQGHVAPKGKGDMAGEKKTKSSLERSSGRPSRSSLKEEVPERSHKLEDEPELATGEGEEGTELETERNLVPPTPEEIPEEIAEEAPEAPAEAPEEAPTEAAEEAPTPRPIQAAPQEKPRMKTPGEAVTPQQAQFVQVKPKGGKLETGDTTKEAPVLKKEKAKGEGKSAAAETGGEKGIAPTVHAPIQGAGFLTEKTQEVQQPHRSATIRDLAAQIIDRIQVMRKEDQTSTIITLRHPPILSGATITLTASDHAKREFNITFANLSPDAKLFLDRKLKEDSLTQNLERKGIVVHNLTTTTQAETVITADAGQGAKERHDQQQEQQQQQKRQQQAEEEENL